MELKGTHFRKKLKKSRKYNAIIASDNCFFEEKGFQNSTGRIIGLEVLNKLLENKYFDIQGF